ncbi:MAG: hypothetical protein GY711_18740 [bacterium]|nr:hypothetical protein [bacterium]
MRHTSGLLAALLICVTANAAPPQRQPDYPGLAAEFLARHGKADAQPDTFELKGVLAEHYLHARMGLFDLYLPADGADKDRAEDYRDLCVALLGMQESWLDWLAPATGSPRADKKDIATLTKWVKSWRPGRLVGAAASGDREVLDALDAKDAVREAAERFGRNMGTGMALGLERTEEVREPVVLLHDRYAFVQFLCFGAWLHDHLRSVFWQPDIVNWTHFYVDDVKILALQFAAPGRAAGDLSSGVSMNSRTPTGMEQQVVQLAANSMIANYFGDAVPPSLAGAMAVNLVIDGYGECNTRVDGDLRARRTSAREMFVPGGQSEGGVLPPNLADSRWRDGHGADHFVRVLRHSMQAGKGGRKKGFPKGTSFFQLLDDSEIARTTIAAPFLGSAAAGREEPPAKFFGDHLEFLRSYRSCFLYWMQNHAVGSSKRSQRAFAQLLLELARTQKTDDLETVFQATYDGAPLSDVELDKDALEVRFLKWLTRQKVARR